jgi:hypothetical protein
MRRRCTEHAVALAFLAGVVLGSSGCATRFIAKSNNPLKPAATRGWDPGELSEPTRARLASLGFVHSWRENPAIAIASLERKAPSEFSARRAVIEVALAAGIRAEAKFLTNRGAAGLYLCAAEHAWDGINRRDAESQEFLTTAGRYALSRLANLREIAVDHGLEMRPEIAGPTRSYHVKVRDDLPGSVRIDQFKKLLPVDRFRVVGARESALVEGVGAPLVGKLRGPPASVAVRDLKLVDDSWLALTATVEFGPPAPVRRATFTVYDRKHVETVAMGPHRETLAADFSTPFAVRVRELQRENYITLGILGFLRGDRYFESTGLYPQEFPRGDKIPVVFVHGLISDPTDWRFLHNALLADPEIRQHYQFWAFNYPTSMAVPWSSNLLRRDLERAQKKMNASGEGTKIKQMVLIGHSMGGLLSRMQISKSTPEYYHSYFRKPIDQLRLTEEQRATMHSMYEFSPNEDVSEVIFICVPHRGSELATNWVGAVGRMLARLPLTILKTSLDVLTLNADALASDVRIAPNTSIDSLDPEGKFVKSLQFVPMSDRVEKHSIIGDRGNAGDLAKSSDGVVPYWSSHLDGVPETIIPSNHSGPEHEKCASVVKELLLQRLRQQSRAGAR